MFFGIFPPAIAFIICCACLNWLKSWFTLAGLVPLPRAMRRRRLPPMIYGWCRS
jgi:hypothetical protein